MVSKHFSFCSGMHNWMSWICDHKWKAEYFSEPPYPHFGVFSINDISCTCWFCLFCGKLRNVPLGSKLLKCKTEIRPEFKIKFTNYSLKWKYMNTLPCCAIQTQHNVQHNVILIIQFTTQYNSKKHSTFRTAQHI